MRLNGQQRRRLTASPENWKRAHGYDVFAAVDVPGFEDAAAEAFENIPTQQHIEIARHYPSRHFLKACLLMLSRANSYDGAEFTLEFRVLPLAIRMEAIDVRSLLETLKNNEQAYHAPRIAVLLAELADVIPSL
jgi:CheY-like chemotaxis protein